MTLKGQKCKVRQDKDLSLSNNPEMALGQFPSVVLMDETVKLPQSGFIVTREEY